MSGAASRSVPAPTRRYVDAEGLPEPGVTDRAADERSEVHRELGDQKVLEPTDDVGVSMTRTHPAGELLAELPLQRQDARRSRELQVVHRVVLFDDGQNREVWRRLAQCQCDVGVGGVPQVRYQGSRSGGAGGDVGLDRVELADQDRDVIGVEIRAAAGSGSSTRYGMPSLASRSMTRRATSSYATQDDVPSEPRRERRAVRAGGCAPRARCVEVTDEGEGQDDEQEHHAGEKDQDGEGPAEIALERDVAEAERGHHRRVQ